MTAQAHAITQGRAFAHSPRLADSPRCTPRETPITAMRMDPSCLVQMAKPAISPPRMPSIARPDAIPREVARALAVAKKAKGRSASPEAAPPALSEKTSGALARRAVKRSEWVLDANDLWAP